MSLAATAMPPLTYYLIATHYHSAHHRIGRNPSGTLRCQMQRTTHIFFSDFHSVEYFMQRYNNSVAEHNLQQKNYIWTTSKTASITTLNKKSSFYVWKFDIKSLILPYETSHTPT
jgi:hypothetical protein